jgi:glycerol-3-phosphate acyltransferase PlsY
MNFYTVVIFLITYLICSINPAIEICKRRTGEDIRKLGSGNAGTANAMRVLGRIFGIFVIILDISKVFLSFYIITFIGKTFGKDTEITLKSIFIVAAVIGHCFPIYYGFKGGKGVIVGITVGVIINPQIALVCIISSLVIILLTRLVALGTIGGVILYIIMSLVMMTEYLIPVLIATVIIMFKHRASIQRILTKQEEKFW